MLRQKCAYKKFFSFLNESAAFKKVTVDCSPLWLRTPRSEIIPALSIGSPRTPKLGSFNSLISR